jgi:ribonuclease P protein component
MLPRKYRINRQLFKEIFAKGKSFHSDLIFLKIADLADKNSCFTFVVPIKTVKKAVRRNKIKRRARAIIYKNLSLFKNGVGAIFFFKKGSEKLNFSELEKEIITISQKSKILLE